ncbi:diguanylate cyclase (GGDEF) domain-containing protein [Pseudobutyrivibrio sp. YE44]|uniref:GGDEF domain-containing protein n=1 Tax=Pseudobutyrivibrio sp. YE44 TaxID=1520802 RepID=UPI0008802651|nr:GGDEF domain-containing protein [Pseudobutyrivibrio sp. YE44]SDB51550.1 diguanylate cyclase (GGDEF) domain-containing protein [Pseudobutyrivibrio sp. YE44]
MEIIGLSKITKMHKRENKQILEYFHTCMDDINEANLFMLRKVCMYVSITYLVVLVLGFSMVRGYGLTLGHILIFPLLIVYFFFNLYARNNGKKIHTNLVGIICCSFYFLLACAFIYIDIFSKGLSDNFWTTMLVLVFPTLYIDRMYKYGTEELLVVVIYGVVAYFIEERDLFLKHLYLLFAAYIISMLAAHIVLEMRSRECLYAKELKRFSSLDKLTHVLNKAALVDRMEEYFVAKPAEEPCAICIIDLDNFKDVNDNLGHNAGDMLLERVGQLLIDNFRAYDVIGRYGGDEFVVLMPQMGDVAILQMRCRTMQMFLGDFDLGSNHDFSVSIGAAICDGIRNYEEVFKMADDALYKSKLEGKNRCNAWVIDAKTYEKPILLSIRGEMTEAVRRMYAAEGERFDIVTALTNDDALRTISQYHNQIRIILLEVDKERGLGDTVLKYIKNRQSFASIPVLALAMDQESSFLAHDFGADEVIMIDSPDEEYRRIIDSLVRM